MSFDMPPTPLTDNASQRKAYVITGPTSGIGRATALEIAEHGEVVLVGRDREKLNDLQSEIQRKDGSAVPVECDFSDIASVRRAAANIVALRLPIVGLLNNWHHADARHQEHPGLGHDVRNGPPRTVRIDRGAHAASPRRCERRLCRFRRGRS